MSDGGDMTNYAVDTKIRTRDEFGNDAIGFIRVRKRKLKGVIADASLSFDLVRAVRIDGKPGHEFVLGLGSQKNHERRCLVLFWACAINRMKRHGLTAPQRQRLAAEMIRKGARLPTVEQCRGRQDWDYVAAVTPELLSIIEAAA
jgi:hypothetical protein